MQIDEGVRYQCWVNKPFHYACYRASDIFKPIELGHRHYLQADVTRGIPKCLGSSNAHKQLLLRLVLLQNDADG